MNYRHSLRFRIIAGFSLMGITLTLVYGIVSYVLLLSSEHNYPEKVLPKATQHFLREYERERNLSDGQSQEIGSAIGFDKMPEPYREIVKDLPDGFYKTGKDGIGGEAGYHFSVTTLPDRSEKLYVYVSDRFQPAKKHRRGFLHFTLFVVTITVILLGIGISFLVSRRVIAPIIQLSETVEKFTPDNLPTRFGGGF